MEKLNQQKLSQQGLIKFSLHALKKFVLVGCVATLAACGGGGSPEGSSSTTFPLTVDVSGLGEHPVMLQNNDGIDGDNVISISANGQHLFPKEIAFNGKYLVSVKLQPEDGECRVENGEGSAVRAAIPMVHLICSAGKKTITIGGNVSGLKTGNEILLQNNGVDNIAIRTNGPYSFTARYAPKTGYRVTIAKPPVGQNCDVSNSTGEVEKDITDVNIACTNTVEKVSIGGTVNGLDAGKEVILTNVVNNNGVFETLPVSANGQFTFGKHVELNSAYAVNVAKSPDGQTCSAQSNSGIAAQNITTVVVNCVAVNNSFTISGNLEGLNSGNEVILQNNSGDDLGPLKADGKFTFSKTVPNGSTYNVTVKAGAFPFLQDCKFTNGSGTVAGADVTNVLLKCTIAPVSVLHPFAGVDGLTGGYYPVGLMQATDGTFYGIATNLIGQFEPLNAKTGYIFTMKNGAFAEPENLWLKGSGCFTNQPPSFPTGIMQAGNGNIYGTTFLAGTDVCNIGNPLNEKTFGGAIYSYDVPTDNFVQTDYMFPSASYKLPNTLNLGPVADLIQDKAGNFYGITYGDTVVVKKQDQVVDRQGGMVFKMNLVGGKPVITVLHDFKSFQELNGELNGIYSDGVLPNGKLTLVTDSGGSFLYGVTEKGGDNGKGMIFKIDLLKPTGSNFTPVHSFENLGTFPPQPGVGFNGIFYNPYARPYSGLYQATDGHLYGVAKYGGAFNAGRIYKLNLSTGAVETVYSFDANNAFPVGELIQLPDGNLYGTTQGSNVKENRTNIGSIFRFSPKDCTSLICPSFTILHTFKGASVDDGSSPSTRLVQGKDGSLYGGTRYGGVHDNGTIYKLGRN